MTNLIWIFVLPVVFFISALFGKIFMESRKVSDNKYHRVSNRELGLYTAGGERRRDTHVVGPQLVILGIFVYAYLVFLLGAKGVSKVKMPIVNIEFLLNIKMFSLEAIPK